MNEPRGLRSGELARTALQLLVLGGLLLAVFWILQPFLMPLTWAAMIAVALWPVLLRLQAVFGGRRALATVALTLVLLLVLVVPLYLGVGAVVANADRIAALPQELATREIPRPPDWLESIPLAGKRAAAAWLEFATESPEARAARVSDYGPAVARWILAELGSVGAIFVSFLLTVILSAVLFSTGEQAAAGVRRFARWLGGATGEQATVLAGQAVRAVALGVVMTAALQTVLVGLGFAAIGVPLAAVLTVASFVLSIAQIGPLPLLIGVVIWAYATLGGGWGTAYLVWAVVCGTIDNFVRPVLIKRGADLPLLLVFAGVIGGLVAFGVVGLFVGPTVLAVGYMLLGHWMDEGTEGAAPR